jgi:hypothetical protein
VQWHPTEDDLILHFYGECEPTDERQVDDHLRTCVACQDAWTDLQDTMKLVDVASVPEPPAGFERVMWARVRQELPDRMAPKRQGFSVRAWAPVMAFAAVIFAVITIGYTWMLRQAPVAPAADTRAAARTTDASRVRERVLLTALDQHFQQTEMLLVELMNAPDQPGEFEFERSTADDLLASGRLYRATAEQNGQLQFAAMLDDLEAVLVEVARSPQKFDRSKFASLRERIDDNGLLFKVRAVTNQIRGRQQVLMNASE